MSVIAYYCKYYMRPNTTENDIQNGIIRFGYCSLGLDMIEGHECPSDSGDGIENIGSCKGVEIVCEATRINWEALGISTQQ